MLEMNLLVIGKFADEDGQYYIEPIKYIKSSGKDEIFCMGKHFKLDGEDLDLLNDCLMIPESALNYRVDFRYDSKLIKTIL